MKTFEEMTPTERFAISNERKNARFLARRATLGFENIEKEVPNVKFDWPFELPPSPLILEPKPLGEVLAHSGPWTKFLVLTYAHKGRIAFTKREHDLFEIEVRFEPQPCGQPN